MNIILLGAPGSGKGTQANRLKEAYGLEHITTGDLCRQEAALDTERGREIKMLMEKGDLISEALMIEMLEDKLVERKSKATGFLLDGFPRTMKQAEALEDIFKRLKLSLSAALEIRVPIDHLKARILGRITCKSCGEVYHIDTRPPHEDGVCDKCGSLQLERRKDDREDALLKRLEVYSNVTAPLVPYYEGKGMLHVIDGTKSVDDVFKSIENLMRQLSAGSKKVCEV